MQFQNKRILHITPHLGGGVGTVLLNYLKFAKDGSKYSHAIATLDYANEKAIQKSIEVGFELFSDMHKNIKSLLNLAADAEIILIHFWNHPLLYDFLIRNELPPSRVIFWMHTAGNNLPYIFPEKSLKYPDLCVFSTPLSFEAKEVKALKDKSHLRLIWATGGNDKFKDLKFKKHETFNIGYIGTVDYFRLHPDFLNICAKINIPNIKFIFCGGNEHIEYQKKVQEMGLEQKFLFLGPIENIEDYLAEFDVFGYLLSRSHCGSCDQALQEAMSAGIVPVVFNNNMEETMIKHNKTGLVAQNDSEYVEYIEKLYSQPELREKISQNARMYAFSNYSLERMNEEWNKIFEEILEIKKDTKKWDISIGNPTGFDVFLESLGDFASNFVIKSEKDIEKIKEYGQMPNWSSKTRGTVHQYYTFFNQDEKLKKISQLMNYKEFLIE